MADSTELLFFDTFSHESSEELNLDLVQFPKPVYISEVRIIPLGARVQADFPGGVRLGATNPSQFEIEFFVNDLSKPGASTFESLGEIEYKQNVNIQLECDRRIPTDGLVLRGWYTTITLAVYGVLAKAVQEQAPPPPPVMVTNPIQPTVPTVDHPRVPTESVVSSAATAEWVQQHSQVTELPSACERPAYVVEETDSQEAHYGSSYRSDQYHQPPDYSHQYREDWTQQPRPVTHAPQHGGPEIYEISKDPRAVSYENDQLAWENGGSLEEKLHWERERGKDRDRDRHRERERDRSRDRDADREWDERTRRDDRERSASNVRDIRNEGSWNGHVPPPHRLGHHMWERNSQQWETSQRPSPSPGPSRSPKRPHTPPQPPSQIGGEKSPQQQPASRWPSSTSPRSDRKEVASPSLSPGVAQKFESLSPGDVESISEGEIPETEGDLEPINVKEENIDSENQECINTEDKGTDHSTILDSGVLPVNEAEPSKTGPSESKVRPVLSPSGATSVPVTFSPVKTATTSPAIPPCSPPVTQVSTPLDSPAAEETSMDVEPFEPILSDEDIVDENEGQFGDIDYDYEYPEELTKTFTPPCNCEIQPLLYFSETCSDVQNTNMTALLGQAKKGKDLSDLKELEKILLAYKKEYLSTENISLVQEEWVHTTEQISPLISKTILNISEKEDIVSILCKFVQFGLDFDLALQQPQPGYKVRHLKAGLRLVEALCNQGEKMIEYLLQHVDIHHQLLNLYHKDYMALSIKLMILKTLDLSLLCKQSVEQFLGRTKVSQESEKKFEQNCYQILLKMIRENQVARVKFSISCLLRKIHIYEVVERFTDLVKQIAKTSLPNCNTEEASEEVKSYATKENAPDDNPEEIVDISELDIDVLISSLEEILRVYRDASLLISQPKYFLPVCSQFEVNISGPNPYSALYSYFRAHHLLESFLLLLTCPSTASYSSIIGPVHEILGLFLESFDGMVFIFSNIEVANSIMRVLLPQAPAVSPGQPEENLDESASSVSQQQLGIIMTHRLQVLQYVDSIFAVSFNSCIGDPDQSEILEHLQGLFNLGFTHYGKMALAHVLSRGHNICALLQFFTGDFPPLTPNTQNNNSKLKGSAARSYAADLIVLTVKYSDNVNFLRRFGKDILEAGLKDESLHYTRLFEAVPWLKPVKNPSVFLYDNISALCDIVKNNVDNVTALPGELITAMRILKFLGVPLRDKDLTAELTNPGEYPAELKYKYVILQLFSKDGVVNLVSLLQKLCAYYEQPALHSTSFIGHHGTILAALILPLVQLLRRLLTYVITCRNTDFKDLTAVPVLLQTYTLMQAYPSAAQSFAEAQLICREITETLLAYTQPVSSDPSSETEALNRSLWTMMVSEVLKYILTGPHTFIAGLLILSELLPLPLPVQTRIALPEDEVTRCVNVRKLWSAHLHSLSTSIQELIATISGSSFQPLLQLLRRVCVQLADMAAPTALIVSRGILDTLLLSLQPSEQTVSNSSVQSSGEILCSGHTARLLNFLACLVTHPSIKVAVLQLVVRGSNIKSDERYPGLISSLCSILRTPSDMPAHIQAQECVVSVIQSLCDTEVTLLPPPIVGDQQGPETYLANALPPRDLLLTFCSVMLEHISNVEHSFTTLLPTLRTFLMLTEHDYGFYHLKSCLEKKPDSLRNLFMKFCRSFSKDSSDCLSTLSTSLDLLRVFLSPEFEDDSALVLPPRSLVVNIPELALILGWKNNETEEGDDKQKDDSDPNGANVKRKHPLYCLEKLLQEFCNEDDALESLHENVVGLISLLEEEGSKPMESKEILEPILPPAEPLLGQFAARPIYVVGEVDDERLGSTYWLAPPPVDDADQDMDQVNCDLMEISRLYLPEFHLPMETERICRIKNMADDDDDADQLKKRVDDMNKYLPTDSKNKRPFVAPMRGRGFGRSVPQRGDLFRSRPPNTSRPPSLHVDDFVALEISGQQPTGPTGYNKISMRAKDMLSTRSRGRGRAFASDRGRFFGSGSPYNRRENGRGISRGANTMSPRVGGNGRGNLSPAWPPHNAEDQNQGSQQTSRSFRSPEMRELRMMPRSDDKFGATGTNRFVGGRGTRGNGSGNWTVKESRERFGGSPLRGTGRREPVGRHLRSFTR